MKKIFDINSIRFKLTVLIVTSIFLAFNAFIFYSTERYKQFIAQSARKQVLSEVERYVFEIKNLVERQLGDVNSLAHTLSAVKSPNNPISLNRDQVISLMKNNLYDNAMYNSLGVYWEPNAFDLKDQEYIGKLYHDATGNFTPRIRRGTNSTLIVEPDSKAYLQPFYLLPKQNQKNYIGEPKTISEQNQEKTDIAFSSTINYRGIFYGVVRINVDINNIILKTQELEIFSSTSSLILISSKGRVIAQSNRPDVVNIDLNDLIDSPTEISNLLSLKSYLFSEEDGEIHIDYPIAFKNTTSKWFVRASVPIDTFLAEAKTDQWFWLTLNGIMFLISLLVVGVFVGFVFKPFKPLLQIVDELSAGKLQYNIPLRSTGSEVSRLKNALELLRDSLAYNASFAKTLGSNQFNTAYKPLSDEDELGSALLSMQDNLLKSKEEENEREENEKIRTWTNRGIAEMNEVVRQVPDRIEDLTKAVLLFMIKYLRVNQGGFFVYHEQEQESYFELSAAYAYNKERLVNKKMPARDGLIYSCVKEEKTIYLKEIPEDYLKITSGVGEVSPSYLLITPLIHGKSVLGVIELASFNELEQYEIELVEKAASAIAAEMASIKVKEHTDKLLEEARHAATKMTNEEQNLKTKIADLEQKQTETELYLEELHKFFSAVSGSIFTAEYDLNGIVRDVNETFLHFIDASKEELVGKPHKHSLIDQEFDEDEYNKFWETLRQGEEVNKVFNYKINNRTFWFSENFSPIVNNQGEVVKVVKVSTDITKLKQQAIQLEHQSSILKQHEKELQENVQMLSLYKDRVYNSQTQLNSILQVIEPIISLCEFSFEGIVRSVNTSFETTYHIIKSDIIGNHIRDVIHFEHKEYDDLLTEVLSGKVVRRRKKIFDQAGDRWLSEFFAPVKDNKGELVKIWYIAYEVTDLVQEVERTSNRLQHLLRIANDYKRQLKDALQKNDDLEKLNSEHISLSAALQHLVTITVYSHDGVIQSVNERILGLTGKSRNDLIGLSFHHFVKLPELYDEELFWLDVQEEPHEVETLIKLSEKEIWLSEIYYPIFEDGQVVKIIAIGTNITAMRRTHEENLLINEKVHSLQQELDQCKDSLASQQKDINDYTFFIERYKETLGLLVGLAEFDSNGHLIFADKRTISFYQADKLEDMLHGDFLRFGSIGEYERFWQNLHKGEVCTNIIDNQVPLAQLHVPLVRDGKLVRVALLTSERNTTLLDANNI